MLFDSIYYNIVFGLDLISCVKRFEVLYIENLKRLLLFLKIKSALWIFALLI